MPTAPKRYQPLPASVQQAQRRQQRERYEQTPERIEDRRFYNSEAWRRCRKAFLDQHPTCVDCEAAGRPVTPAEQVDHIQARKDYPELAFEWSNLRGLCRSCHSRRTARDGGGFGHAKKRTGSH